MHSNTGGFAQRIRAVVLPLFFFILFNSLSTFGQDSLDFSIKSMHIPRLEATPVIDGALDPEIWERLPSGTGFIQFRPYNGRRATHETDIRFGFDDTGLYAIAFMYDPYPDSVQSELGRRDQIDGLATDYISIDILPYNDGLTMFEFKVSPAGQQSDNKFSATGREPTWDAVWESATSITDSGWIAEVKIPYDALRFPKTEVQTWGVNVWRRLNRRNEQSTWSYIPREQGEMFRYYGTITGMEGIKPPFRLSLTPYLGGYLEKRTDEEQWNNYLRGGMDLKWGINQSYTLDMQLIPDFGQVLSDDVILNLSPFEIRYEERRQFFTEGTEMFEKCDIFYTRRVGAEPRGYDDAYDSLQTNEIITENPDLTQVINATKISGRNRNGLGIGIFNGMTTNTWAKAKDTITGETRRISTQPFTNYNVIVFDQNLPNNSYVTLINTNYLTPDWKYSANVTGTEAKFVNRRNTFATRGQMIVSQHYLGGSKPEFGYNTFLRLYRPSGTVRYSLSSRIIDDQFDPNDMGFQVRTNEVRNNYSLSYNIFNPVWKINDSRTSFDVDYYTRFDPYELMFVRMSLRNNTTWRNFWEYEFGMNYSPLGFYDFYEPREENRYFYEPPSWSLYFEMRSDERKKLAVGLDSWVSRNPDLQFVGYGMEVTPRYRVSDRLAVSLYSEFYDLLNDYGWVNTDSDVSGNPIIYFGQRDIRTVENILESRYVFSTATSLNLRIRHYWSAVSYNQYYTLQDDGNLITSDYDEDHDLDFNAFNLDLQFLWFFAPGSQLSALWKNIILNLGDEPSDTYFQAFSETINGPQTNSFSIRILYFLDYNYVKKMVNKNRRKDS
jgi:hypothetical protein